MTGGLVFALRRETQTTNTQDGLPEKIKFLLHRRIRMPLRNRW